MIEKKNILGIKVKLARIEADLTQIELAEKINYDRQVVIRIENGTKIPNINDLRKIAEVTGKDINFFLEDKPEINIATNHSKDFLDLRGLKDTQRDYIEKLKEEFIKSNADK
ncbi:MAG: helix-turn-helix domain-containing protein [Candidatus Humimicrobiaceae bacterium]